MSTLEMHEQFEQANTAQRLALESKGDVMVDLMAAIEEVKDRELRTYQKTLLAQLMQNWGEAVQGLSASIEAVAEHEAECEVEE